jgi:hypothetical protein
MMSGRAAQRSEGTRQPSGAGLLSSCDAFLLLASRIHIGRYRSSKYRLISRSTGHYLNRMRKMSESFCHSVN